LPLAPTISNKESPNTKILDSEISDNVSEKFVVQFSEFQEKFGKSWEQKFTNFSREKPPQQDGEIVVREPSEIAAIIHTRYLA
jgi:hypothetical protein